MSTWIDFRVLKQTLDFAAVLRHYGVEVKAKGTQHHGYCPLPNHNGKKNSPSFSANLEKGIFQCFGCGAHGNILDFATLMEKGSPEKARDIRKTALSLQKAFNIPQPDRPEVAKRKAAAPQKEIVAGGDVAVSLRNDANKLTAAERGELFQKGMQIVYGGSAAKEATQPKSEAPKILVNAPLDFELKTLDFAHPYLRTRGFTDKTIKDFGLGYCSKGYHAGRIAIPLQDDKGRLVGYAGRIVDENLISEENSRYKFPGSRARETVKHEFRKSEFLYGGYRITSSLDDLVVVEGFPSVWWLTQNAIPNVVALMGWSCSERQAELIVSLVKPFGRVWLMPDGDESGERCAESVLLQVAPSRFVRWVKLEADRQPTDCKAEELFRLLKTPTD